MTVPPSAAPPSPETPHVFALHGVRLVSDVLLPPYHALSDDRSFDGPVPQSDHAVSLCELVLRRGPVSVRLDGPCQVHGLWQVGDAEALLVLDRVARLRLEAAGPITYTLETGADLHDLAALIWGTVLPMALAWRGQVVLRGTALSDGREVLLLVGDAAAGKTTLALALLERGWRLVSDGVVVLTHGSTGSWLVPSGLPAMRVWPDVFKRVAIEGGSAVRDKVGCAWVCREVETAPGPVRTIVRLSAQVGRPGGFVDRLHGKTAYRAIAEACLPSISAPSGRQGRELMVVSAAARLLSVFHLGRAEHDAEATVRLLDAALEGRMADGSGAACAPSVPACAPSMPGPPPEAAPPRPGYIWLASFPKSGNTWMRALLSAWLAHSDCLDVNDLLGSGPVLSRAAFERWCGVESAVLTAEELLGLRAAFMASLPLPERVAGRLVKTHEARLEAAERLYAPELTAGVVYLVRNPLDVAVSFAHHMGRPIDETITLMARSELTISAQRETLHPQLPQRVRGWSEHVASWLESDLPLVLVRYEDMLVDPEAALRRVLDLAGFEATGASLAAAVDAARFERLQAQEREHGFAERSRAARTFFREGRAGGWRERLTAAQVARVVADHGAMMERLGYLP